MNAGLNMTDGTSFGPRLRTLRQERGLSQVALAGEEISTGYLSRLESGARQPTERVIVYLADRLGVDRSAFESPPTTNSLTQAMSIAGSSDDDDAVEELITALAESPDADAFVRWQALWTISQYHRRRGERDQEEECLVQLTGIADDLGLATLQVRSRTQLARCIRSTGAISRALGLAESALRMAKDAGLATSERASALLVLVSVEAESGRLPDARAHADELVTLAADAPSVVRTEALWSAATVRSRLGEREKAQELLRQAMDTLDSHDSPLLWARLRLAAASLYLQSRPPLVGAAHASLTEAQSVLTLIGTPLQQQEMLVLQAHLAHAEGRLTDARHTLDRINMANVVLTYRDRIRLSTLDSLLLIAEGKQDQGLRQLKELAEDSHQQSNLDLAAEIWRILAEELEKSGRPRADRG
jgi:transcriptional regulator with XRE-family HTH domain